MANDACRRHEQAEQRHNPLRPLKHLAAEVRRDRDLEALPDAVRLLHEIGRAEQARRTPGPTNVPAPRFMEGAPSMDTTGRGTRASRASHTRPSTRSLTLADAERVRTELEAWDNQFDELSVALRDPVRAHPALDLHARDLARIEAATVPATEGGNVGSRRARVTLALKDDATV